MGSGYAVESVGEVKDEEDYGVICGGLCVLLLECAQEVDEVVLAILGGGTELLDGVVVVLDEVVELFLAVLDEGFHDESPVYVTDDDGPDTRLGVLREGNQTAAYEKVLVLGREMAGEDGEEPVLG